MKNYFVLRPVNYSSINYLDELSELKADSQTKRQPTSMFGPEQAFL